MLVLSRKEFLCRPKPRKAVQKADLRRHLEQIYPNSELEQWFDPLDVRLDGEKKEIWVLFPHVYFARQFRDTVVQSFERGLQTHLGEWSLHLEEDVLPAANRPRPGARPRRNTTPPAPHLTFDSFLYNRKNDFPLAAARACACSPLSPPYVPLVIHGQSGAGKTHLLAAMAREALESAPDLDFFYGPALQLPLSRSFSALFLDDLHLVQDQAVQERITLLLDFLSATGKLCACTLDTNPTASRSLSPALAQRLGAGLVVELKKPDLEVRRRYAAVRCEPLSMDKAETLALAQRYADFRAIDGAINRVRAYGSLLPERSIAPAEILGETGQKALSPEQIIAVCARSFSITSETLMGKSRDRQASEARPYAITLCRELLGLSLPQLGRIFGGRDHSSIAYSLKKFQSIQASNNDTHKAYTRLKQMCLTPGS